MEHRPQTYLHRLRGHRYSRHGPHDRPRRPPTRLLGIRDTFDGSAFVHHLLTIQGIELPRVGADSDLRDIYRAFKARRLTHDRNPQPGDLVFFHNTEDADGDGRQNDWYTLAGVVEAVDPDGTVTLIAPVRGEVVRRVVTVSRPQEHRDSESGKGTTCCPS